MGKRASRPHDVSARTGELVTAIALNEGDIAERTGVGDGLLHSGAPIFDCPSPVEPLLHKGLYDSPWHAVAVI